MGFEFHAVDSRFQVLESGFILILDAGFHETSEIVDLHSGFQSPGFRITQENITRIPEPDHLTWAINIPEIFHS